MRDRYYLLASGSDLPLRSALARIWGEAGAARARLDGDEEDEVAAPDLILFRTALARLRHDLVAIFVRLEDESLWQDEWGDLVRYRGGRINEKPALQNLQAPAFDIAPDVAAAWDYTLNLNSITSPSLTT